MFKTTLLTCVPVNECGKISHWQYSCLFVLYSAQLYNPLGAIQKWNLLPAPIFYFVIFPWFLVVPMLLCGSLFCFEKYNRVLYLYFILKMVFTYVQWIKCIYWKFELWKLGQLLRLYGINEEDVLNQKTTATHTQDQLFPHYGHIVESFLMRKNKE